MKLIQLKHSYNEFLGITQKQVDESPPIATVLMLFRKWIEEKCQEHQFIVNDLDSEKKKATFLTW